MSVAPISAASPTPETIAPSPAQAAQTREVARAVQRLNDQSFLPDNRQFSLSLDPATKVPVVRVLDATTHEVLNQFPAEYILRITAYLEEQLSQQNAAQTLSFLAEK